MPSLDEDFGVFGVRATVLEKELGCTIILKEVDLNWVESSSKIGLSFDSFASVDTPVINNLVPHDEEPGTIVGIKTELVLSSFLDLDLSGEIGSEVHGWEANTLISESGIIFKVERVSNILGADLSSFSRVSFSASWLIKEIVITNKSVFVGTLLTDDLFFNTSLNNLFDLLYFSNHFGDNFSLCLGSGKLFFGSLSCRSFFSDLGYSFFDNLWVSCGNDCFGVIFVGYWFSYFGIVFWLFLTSSIDSSQETTNWLWGPC